MAASPVSTRDRRSRRGLPTDGRASRLGGEGRVPLALAEPRRLTTVEPPPGDVAGPRLASTLRRR